MIYIIISTIFLWVDRNKRISRLFFFLLLISSIAAYLVGRQPQFDFSTQFWTLYSGVLLAILFQSFKGYQAGEGPHWQDINQASVDTYSKWILVLGGIALVINVFLLTKVFSSLIAGAIAVQSFKNEGEAADFYASLFPHRVMIMSYLLSPLAYIALPLHFYYLSKRQLKKSLLSLLVSLLIVLSGLVSLSRSATIQYVLVYVLFFAFMAPMFSKKMKQRMSVIAAVFLVAIFAGLSIVSGSRFSEFYSKKSKNPAILDEQRSPLLFSTIDYFSAWEENGPAIMEKHDISHTYCGLYNSCGIAAHMFSQQYSKVLSEVEQKLGDIHNGFHGLIARLLYDYGKIGTIFFIILLSSIIRNLGPKNGIVRFKTLLGLSSILPVCALFFAGNQFASLYLDMGIVYCIAFYLFVKKRKKVVVARQVSPMETEQISA